MSQNLPAGFSLTSLDGRKCTVVPRALTTISGDTFTVAEASSLSSSSTVSTSSSTSITTSPQETVPTAIIAGPQVAATQADVTTATTASTTSQSSVAALSNADPAPSSTSTSRVTASTSTVIEAASAARTSSPEFAPTTTSPIAEAAAVLKSQSSPSQASSSSSVVTSSKLLTSSSSSSSSDSLSSSSSSSAATQAQNQSSPSIASLLVPTNKGSGGDIAGTPSPTASHTGATSHDTSSATAHTNSSSGKAGAVVGGVIGACALVSILGLLLWFWRRRRRRHGSQLAPVENSSIKSEFEDHEQPRSFKERLADRPGIRFGEAASVAAATFAGVAAAMRSKIVSARSTSPNVNLNRGNSQFLEGQIPTHVRNDSSLSRRGRDANIRNRMATGWASLREVVTTRLLRKKSRQSVDPFTRGMSETRTVKNPPDFSTLLALDEHALVPGERRRTSSSPPLLGSLGLDFGAMDDPFRDPIAAATTKSPTTNSLSGPVAKPRPSIQKDNTYVKDNSRSRGYSVDAFAQTPLMQHPPRKLSIGNVATCAPSRPGSRYPSTIAPTRDSYRDTDNSSYSTTGNARRGKGRSDPFDLEQPELWRPKVQVPTRPLPHTRNTSVTSPTTLHTSIAEEAMSQTTRPRLVSLDTDRNSLASYTSRYSGNSELSILNDDWEGPGPDLGENAEPTQADVGGARTSLKVAGVAGNRLSESQCKGSRVSQISNLSGVSEGSEESEFSTVSGKTVGKAM